MKSTTYWFRSFLHARKYTATASEQVHTISEKLKESKAAQSAWEALKGAVQSRLFLIGAVGAVGLFAGAHRGLDEWYKAQVYRRVERGFCPEVGADMVVQREKLEREIVDVLTQKAPTKFFHVIHGSHGTGKSILVKQACRGVGGGVGYMQAGALPQQDFGQRLGNAINFNFQQHALIFNVASRIFAGTAAVDEGSGKLSALSQAASALETAAHEYRRQHGRPFILVVDDVDRLDEDLLDALQEYAKDWAEKYIIVTVFVVSNPTTMDSMQGNLSWVRCFEPITIPELSDEDSLRFIAHLGVSGEPAHKTVGLVGGRFHQLEKCAAMVRQGRPWEDVRRSILHGAERAYTLSGIMDHTEQQEAGIRVVQSLVKSGCTPPRIDIQTWRTLVPTTQMQQSHARVCTH